MRRNRRSRLTLLLSVLVTVCACNKNADIREMTEDSTVRLTVQGVTEFSYNPVDCQLGFCRQKCEFRVHTDNMSDWFTVTLDRIPATEGATVTADISWTGSSSLESRHDVALEAIRVEGDRIWLWSSQNGILTVLKVLE